MRKVVMADQVKRGDGVQSVARALGLLNLLGQTDDGARVSDLARQAGLAVSTAHRLLTTLEQHGYAQFDPERALWHVGRQAFAVGAGFTRRRNFVAPALPLLRRLRDATRETVNLGILDDDQIVTVSQVESREIVRAISPPGGKVPAVCSAMGKAILATWPDDDIAALTARAGFPRLTYRSHRDRASLTADITVIRRRGWAIDDEEHAPGLRCVGAVVWSPQGEAACAISVSALASRLPMGRCEPVGELVAQAAEQLGAQLGGVRGGNLIAPPPQS